MNWRNKDIFVPLFITLAMLMMAAYLKNSLVTLQKGLGETQIDIKNSCGVSRTEPVKEKVYEELSPDRTKKVVRYEITNVDLFNDYHDYLNNKVVLAIKDEASGDENFIYWGEERTGNPHWLGESYIFVKGYCGSGCFGLSLINIQSHAIIQSTVSFIGGGDTATTDFSGWFNKKFEFSGFLGNVRSEIKNNQPLLIFSDGKNEKKLLFSGNSLKELN